MALQKLSTGEQDFGRIREDNRLYVDKTRFVYELLEYSNQNVFLSRPRRFGKSLFITTLKQVFLGNKKLFEGLYIEDKIEWEKHPVIHLDFSKMGFKDLGLYEAIERRLSEIAEEYEVGVEEKGIALKFAELIKKLHEKTGMRVAILIDEYDKPITEYLEFGQKADKARDTLRTFYGILKGNSAHIRMVFITGISRFAKVSLFSDLNNFSDISFSKAFHDICGYNTDELKENFRHHVASVAQEMGLPKDALWSNIKEWYNGYSWDGLQKVYNPYSILRFLDEKQFMNYWFESGTPKFLIKMLKGQMRYQLNNTKVSMSTFDNYDFDNLNAETLLFQTGYLTIKEKDFAGRFLLGYPNREVEKSLQEHLLIDYAQNALGASIAINLIEAVHSHDMQAFMETVNTLFANIPAEIFLRRSEAYFHSILYMSLKLCGFHIESEVRTSKGRIDALMRHENRLYLFEFKITGTAEEALQQIHEKKYYAPYEGEKLEIYLVGIKFSTETKEVEEWIAEML